MPHPEGVPTTRITLGGKSYELAWTWGAKRRVRDVLAVRGKDDTNTSAEERFALALWASMDEESRSSIKVEEVEDLIHPGNEEEVAERLNALTEKSEPEKSEGNGKPATKEGTVAGPPSRTAGQSESTISA